ncbi:hypothetical protein OGAPHI_005200 [Ogataea philodendri]|uniref:Uncharacterized protein n=1 Tax=Ogataea philodendri TaxID=1378263 RepID=A0A9P8P229_9ASCO|nr:uncharacterized protein OGAPHI_005200 [Ogataea philodendri]KAH3663797.1 hypothetical protein OGAPHI_005200 [Ogataea philodendri]
MSSSNLSPIKITGHGRSKSMLVILSGKNVQSALSLSAPVMDFLPKGRMNTKIGTCWRSWTYSSSFDEITAAVIALTAADPLTTCFIKAG